MALIGINLLKFSAEVQENFFTSNGEIIACFIISASPCLRVSVSYPHQPIFSADPNYSVMGAIAPLFDKKIKIQGVKLVD
ncbi:MAG: hypothetical protein F6K39_03530 [Okeania sp. SIO3B3]|nr:hypothetical protein [Okeania sp. SIO3B3]